MMTAPAMMAAGVFISPNTYHMSAGNCCNKRQGKDCRSTECTSLKPAPSNKQGVRRRIIGLHVGVPLH